VGTQDYSRDGSSVTTLTGKLTEDIICDYPYIRYGVECCIDTNNNSICDLDETILNKTSGDESNKEISSEKTSFIHNMYLKTTQFLDNICIKFTKNMIYVILFFGVLILFILIILRSSKKRKSKLIGLLEFKLQHLEELKSKKKISKKNYSYEKEELLQKINAFVKNKYLIGIFAFIGFISLVLINNFTFTGEVINMGNFNMKKNSFNLITFFSIILLVWLFVFLYPIFKNIKSVKLNSKERIKYKRISKLIGKEVYSSLGEYIGKIREIILINNKIDSLKIKLDKKQKINISGIVINYKHVQDIGDIIIIKNTLPKDFTNFY
jgi:sporulation protein YlmC with PRC-barrel domain